MSKKNRLRFAPSPTGFLHIGNLRTVLFAYILSRKLKGSLVLRIEDTDKKRESEGALESLLDILNWIGIEFDEGPHIGGDFSPYIQSERLDYYNKYAQELLKKGEAYYCFCSPERLKKVREEQAKRKEAPKYDGFCRNLSSEEVEKKIKKGEKFVIRQKIRKKEIVKVYDELRGEIIFNTDNLDDHVLVKSDGVPTYQFASVVDDHLMNISHVSRGDEWLASFPKNVLLYKAFDWDVPKFIHFPLILNKEGGKLSKRQGDVFVEDYRRKGYLPEAIINFCALLGWNPKDDNEILSLKEIISKFRIEDLGVSPAIFDKDKLDYLNAYYIRKKSLKELRVLCQPYLEKESLIDDSHDDNFIDAVLALSQERLRKLEDITSIAGFFFKDDLKYDPELLIWKKLSLKELKDNLKELYDLLNKIEKDSWTKESLERNIFDYIKENDKKNGDYLWPLRVSLSGEKNSPSPIEIAAVLGKEKSLKRIKKAINL
jgi:glutamyl-tRNA synthetase